jgi:homoserine kinase
MKNKFSVIIPATTANIGSGFDCIGMAVSMYNAFKFDFTKNNGLTFANVENRFANENNLIYTTFCTIMQKYQQPLPKNLQIESLQNDIPIARGLGSSSTCIVAGLIAANEFADLKLSLNELVLLATNIEGHPDNVAPAILGGLVATACDENNAVFQKVIPAGKYCYYAIIEDNEVSTEDARAVLPQQLTYNNAIFNISRASLLMRAFEQGLTDQISFVTNDAIHQQYRLPLIRNYQTLQPLLKNQAFVTHWISGSGSTIFAMATLENEITCDKILASVNIEKMLIQKIAIDSKGAHVTRLD